MSVHYIDKLKIFIPDDGYYTNQSPLSAHIIVRYNAGHCGGIDPHILNICKLQKENKSLLPLLIIISRNSEVVSDYKNLGVAYVDCTQCKNNFETALQLRNLVKHLNIKLLHCHGYSTNYFLYMLKKISPVRFGKIETVITCHGWVEHTLHKKILTFFDFLTYSMGDAFICVSENGSKRLRKYIKKKPIFTIRNSVDYSDSNVSTQNIHNFYQKYKLPVNKNIICYVGRLDGEKRPDRFIDFACNLSSRRDDVHFIIAGTGSLNNKLLEQVKNSSYNSNITFLGEVYPVHLVYKISKLLYLPSDTEGTPR